MPTSGEMINLDLVVSCGHIHSLKELHFEDGSEDSVLCPSIECNCGHRSEVRYAYNCIVYRGTGVTRDPYVLCVWITISR